MPVFLDGDEQDLPVVAATLSEELSFRRGWRGSEPAAGGCRSGPAAMLPEPAPCRMHAEYEPRNGMLTGWPHRARGPRRVSGPSLEPRSAPLMPGGASSSCCRLSSPGPPPPGSSMGGEPPSPRIDSNEGRFGIGAVRNCSPSSPPRRSPRHRRPSRTVRPQSSASPT